MRAIVEHKDATDAQRSIREIYSGIMAVPTRLLRGWLARLDNKNAQNEFYLTDIIRRYCRRNPVDSTLATPSAALPARGG